MTRSADIIPFAAIQVIKACKALELIAERCNSVSDIDEALEKIREKRGDDVAWRMPTDMEVPFGDSAA